MMTYVPMILCGKKWDFHERTDRKT